MGKRISKQEEELLKSIASKMPIVFHNTHEVHYMTGAEILEYGHVVKEGEQLDPEKKYAYNMPVQLAANHYRRLKHALQANGKKGVEAYMNHIKAIVANHRKQQSTQSL